jgi:WD40 repeat protein
MYIVIKAKADDKIIKVWKLTKEESQLEIGGEYKLHLFGVNALKWNGDGTILASGGNDCNLNILDVNKGKINRNFRLDSSVTCIDFNYSSNLILAGTYENQILLYDLRSKNIISQILAHSEPITSVYFSADSSVMLSASYDGFW